LGAALRYIKYSKDKTTLEQVVNSNKEFQALDRRTAELINSVTGDSLEFEEGEEVINMCKAHEDMKKEAIAEAMEDMKKEAAAEAEKRVLAAEQKATEAKQEVVKAKQEVAEETLASSIKSLMQSLKFSVTQAMDALQIPEEQRASLMSLITVETN
jgi:hypothetical protein